MCKQSGFKQQGAQQKGFTLVELLGVVSLLALLSISIYGPAKELARVWQLTAYSIDAQNALNILNTYRDLPTQPFYIIGKNGKTDQSAEHNASMYCGNLDGVECSLTKNINGYALEVTIDTPEGAWTFMGADSVTTGSGDSLQTILTFYPRRKSSLVSQYTFLPSQASRPRF